MLQPLPAAFVNKFGVILSKKCVLQIFSNQCWEVDVVKVDDYTYFTKGWNAFVKNNHVEFLDFVVFKFVGNSTFEVKIYGKDLCDRKLSKARDTHVETEWNDSTEDDKAEMNPMAQNQRKRKPRKVEREIQMKKHKSKCWGTQTQSKGINCLDSHGFEAIDTKTESKEIIYIDSDPSFNKEIGKEALPSINNLEC